MYAVTAVCICTTVQMQTAVTAYFSRKNLLLYVFALPRKSTRQQLLTRKRSGHCSLHADTAAAYDDRSGARRTAAPPPVITGSVATWTPSPWQATSLTTSLIDRAWPARSGSAWCTAALTLQAASELITADIGVSGGKASGSHARPVSSAGVYAHSTCSAN